jgi:CheY-like chemotaxis protein
LTGVRTGKGWATIVFLAALTGYASSEDQQRAAEAGFARHLAKPASLQMLEEVITSLPS